MWPQSSEIVSLLYSAHQKGEKFVGIDIEVGAVSLAVLSHCHSRPTDRASRMLVQPTSPTRSLESSGALPLQPMRQSQCSALTRSSWPSPPAVPRPVPQARKTRTTNNHVRHPTPINTLLCPCCSPALAFVLPAMRSNAQHNPSIDFDLRFFQLARFFGARFPAYRTCLPQSLFSICAQLTSRAP